MDKKIIKTKNSVVLHTFLFAIFFIFIVYSQNIGRIRSQEIILPLLLVSGLTLLFWFSLRFISKNGRKSGLIVSFVLILFFLYGHIYLLMNDFTFGDIDIGRHRYLLILFSVLFIIGIYYLIKTKRKLDNATTISNVVAFSLIAFVLVNIGMYGIENNGFPSFEKVYYSIDNVGTKNVQLVSGVDSLPDVYFLILDEYAGPYDLKNVLGYDNQEFITSLTEQGFNVASNSHSNYPMSLQSIPATLNMNYVNSLAEMVGSDAGDYMPLQGLYFKNTVMEKFKSIGYKVVSFNTYTVGYEPHYYADIGLCDREAFIGNNHLLDSIGRLSLIGYFVERWSEEEMRKTVRCVFDEFPTVHERFEEPVFVFAHIDLPHPPWIFGPNGESVTPGQPLLLSENPEGVGARGWDVKVAYIDQLKFASKKTLEIVDKILTESDKPSIIIVQSDHGTAFEIDWINPSDDDIKQRLSNFNAIYFPDDRGKDLLYDDRTLVNTFRIVFNSYFNSNYDLLDDRMYWGYNAKPYLFRNVTDIFN